MDEVKLDLVLFCQNLVTLPFYMRLIRSTTQKTPTEAYVSRTMELTNAYPDEVLVKLIEPLAKQGSLILSVVDESTEALISLYHNSFEKLREFHKNFETQNVKINNEKIDGDILDLLSSGRAIMEGYEKELEDSLDETTDIVKKLKEKTSLLWEKGITAKRKRNHDTLLFMSHATIDKPLAVAISREIEAIGIPIWRDDKDIKGGDSIPGEISKSLQEASHFALIYTENSMNRPWVKTEWENAIMLRNSTGKPLIIPILKDGLSPPLPITNIKGIVFDNFDKGMKELYNALNVSSSERLELSQAHKFIKMAEKAVATIKWCRHADSFMTIDEEHFERLEDMEEHLSFIGIPPENDAPNRFIRTSICLSEEMAYPDYDDEFYTFENSAFASIPTLRKITLFIGRILSSLEEN